MAALRRQEFGDGGPFDVRQGFEHETRGGHQRAGVARRHSRLRFAALHLLDGNAHGRIFFVFQGMLRGFVHGHHFGSMHDFDAVQRRAGRCQSSLHLLLIAHHQQPRIRLAVQKCSGGRSGHIQTHIAAHCING